MKTNPTERLWILARKKSAAKLISAVISLSILYLLYRKLDLGSIFEILWTSNPMWLLVSVSLIIPITMANALRFKWASTSDRSLSYFDAFAMTVVAIAMNLFLPAKLGDLSKSHFLYETKKVSAGVSVSVVIFERFCDAFAISSWCLAAWLSGFGGGTLNPVLVPALGLWCISAAFLFTGGFSIRLIAKLQTLDFFRGREKLTALAQSWPDLHRALGTKVKGIVLFSIGLWLLHLTQIWLFTAAVGAHVPFAAGLALSPVILLCGLVPFTLGGIGPRDAATIYLFAAYMGPEPAAAVGILMISRSLIPALAAIPFVRRYVQALFSPKKWFEGDKGKSLTQKFDRETDSLL